jgi:hypothetical protein
MLLLQLLLPIIIIIIGNVFAVASDTILFD